MKKAIIPAGMLLMIAACSNGPSSGTVVDRHYEAGYTYWTTHCSVYTSYYRGRSRTTTHCHPVMAYTPPSWSLKIQPSLGRKAGWRDVDQREYDDCVRNDYYPDCVKGG